MDNILYIILIILLVLSLAKTENNFRSICEINHGEYTSVLDFEGQYGSCYGYVVK